MNIRSITLGIGNIENNFTITENVVSAFFKQANVVSKDNEFSVRTNRITTVPISLEDGVREADIFRISDQMSHICKKTGVRWFCLPFEFSEFEPSFKFDTVGEKLIKHNENLFLNCLVTKQNSISRKGIIQASGLIKRVSRLSNNGFDNFRVGIACNCEPNTPFFPYSYHDGVNGFSIALEIVDEFLDLVKKEQLSLLEFRTKAIQSLTTNLKQVDSAGLKIEEQTGVKYLGLDASLAPFPNGNSSVGLLVERLGIDQFGGSGTVFITSVLTDVIKSSISAVSPRVKGFNGVMYSLLEDDYVALRNDQKLFSLDSLILYSSVCGCGLDMVPVPGDITDDEVASIIYDVASLSIRANKPLGVRLLPINGKQENERTNFNYDFLVDSRVMGIRNRSIKDFGNTRDDFCYASKSVWND